MKRSSKISPLGSKSGSKKDEPLSRSKYVDHSLRFVNWVNSLGIEKTFLGKTAQVLDEKFGLRRITILFLFSMFLSLLLTLKVDLVYTGYAAGDTAASTIKSPVSFEVIDFEATEKKKLEAEKAVLPIYDLDVDLVERRTSGIYEAFRNMRKLLSASPWPQNSIKREEKIKEFFTYKKDFEQDLGQSDIPDRLYEWLVERRFNISIENTILRLIDPYQNAKIVTDLNLLKQMGAKEVLVREVERGGGGQEFTVPIGSLVDYNTVRADVLKAKLPRLERLERSDREKILELLKIVLTPNLTLNRQETANRQLKAREGVLPAHISVKQNQVIVTEGSVIQPSHVLILEEIRKLQNQQYKDFVALVLAVFFVSLILVFFSYLRRFTLNKVNISPKDLFAMGLVTITMVIVCKFSHFILSEALEDKIMHLFPAAILLYLMPAAAGSMLVGLLITSGEVVWLYSVFQATVLSFMFDQSFLFLLYAIVGGIAGARGVFGCKKRNDIYWAGLRVGAVNVLVITLFTLLNFKTGIETLSLSGQLLWGAVAGMLSGFFSSFLAMMLVPLLESLFNYTTDIKLLELSNLNHPLLKEMIVKAPGTYHHSLVVGSMVEAAAEVIGANPLLAKVSSYYHDIGKTEHAQYFIENQKPGQNPHDHLSPHMSKTILIAHVKDGVELGMEYKLGKPIIDVIVQHHGTTLIAFFYNRAIERQDADTDEVVEEEFRYPGPKPQFPEAALCMLADSIEAAARSLDEPNPMRLRNIVKNIIHRKFMDGQLDDCDLTLRDLSLIEDAFIRILHGIYHQRIDYPKKAGGGAGEAPVKSSTSHG